MKNHQGQIIAVRWGIPITNHTLRMRDGCYDKLINILVVVLVGTALETWECVHDENESYSITPSKAVVGGYFPVRTIHGLIQTGLAHVVGYGNCSSLLCTEPITDWNEIAAISISDFHCNLINTNRYLMNMGAAGNMSVGTC